MLYVVSIRHITTATAVAASDGTRLSLFSAGARLCSSFLSSVPSSSLSHLYKFLLLLLLLFLFPRTTKVSHSLHIPLKGFR
jgi:hypothetical protein